MNRRVKVRSLKDDSFYDLDKGDIGFIDGYVKAADDRPYAVVVIPKKRKIALINIHLLEVITDEEYKIRGNYR